ncbi:MAG: fumarylacetoacetate hydrolase family protein [Isosphaeraceae bacterium]|nr:fumarylacetoacetate hydrolase family protein [Isosphaeraceae bacterium]
MRLCRFLLDETVLVGFLENDRVIPLHLACDVFAESTGEEIELAAVDDLLELLPPDGIDFAQAKRLHEWMSAHSAELDEHALPLDEVQLLVPIAAPPKILLLAGNYAAHVAERGGTTAEREETFPYVFMKPPSTTLTHPGDPVVIPKVSPDHIDWECELGVVIGRACKDVDEADALECVAGYTVVNDVTDRKFTPNPGRKPRERDKFFDWLHGKWHDTFCPMGPAILTADEVADPQTLRLTLKVNGETKQDGSTAQMVFPVAAIISFLSRFTTLEPGDVISTGTPSGVGSASNTYLKPGDVVEASIEGIGVLRNPVIAESD